VGRPLLTGNAAARLAQAQQGGPPIYSELTGILTPPAGNDTSALGFDSVRGVGCTGEGRC